MVLLNKIIFDYDVLVKISIIVLSIILLNKLKILRFYIYLYGSLLYFFRDF